jgi:hypothetical protein
MPSADGHRFSRRAIAGLAAGVALSASLAPRWRGAPRVAHAAFPPPRGSAPATSAREHLRSLLAIVPAEGTGLFDREETIVSWSDYATQLAAVGVSAPSADETREIEAFWEFPISAERWLNAVKRLDSPSSLSSSVSYPRVFYRHFGFGLFQIDQAVELGGGFAPVAVRGSFDLTELRATWQATGYEPFDLSGLEAFRLGESQRSSMIASDQFLAAISYATNLDEATLIFAESAAQMDAIVATVRGNTRSILEKPEMAELLDALDHSFVGGELVPGQRLKRPTPASVDEIVANGYDRASAEAIATAVAEERASMASMPPVRQAWIGITAGGPLEALPGGMYDLPATPEPLPANAPTAQLEACLLFSSFGDADLGKEALMRRLEQGQILALPIPSEEIFGDWSVEQVGTSSVVRIRLGFADGVPADHWGTLHRNNLLSLFRW